jgi:PAS domain S-box-containing protein
MELETHINYRALVDQASDGILLFDRSGMLVDVNLKLTEMTGYSQNELRGRSLKDIIPPEDLKARPLRIDSYLDGQQVLSLRRIQRKDGSVFDAEITGGMLKDGLLQASLRDVTTRKRAEDEREVILEIIEGVNATTNLYELLQLIHRSIGRILYAENFFIVLHNKETGMLHPQFFIDKYDEMPPPQQMGRSRTAYVFRTGQPILMTHRNFVELVKAGEVTQIGTPPPVWLGVPLKTPTETIGALVVQHYEDENAFSERDLEFLTSVGHQIALALQRRRAEDAVRESEWKYRSLFRRIVDPIFIVDRESHAFIDFNEAVIRAYGYSSAELHEMTDIDLYPPNEQPESESYFDTSNDTRVFTCIHLTKSGRRMIVEIASDESEYNGRPVWINIVRDVTERKNAEEKLRVFADKLERSNRELQDFASVASHDLQEPLRKIQTFGDRLKSKCAESISDQGLDYLGRMQNAAGRMQTLINDLLTFSRITTKAQPFVSCDLSEIVDAVVSDLEVRIEQTGGRVEVGHLATIDADPLQMRQLFQNLIGNALKFRKPEEPSLVKVNTRLVAGPKDEGIGESSDGELCEITIDDNGIGFDEKYLDRIFTVFQRLHSRSDYEGTGVGLAVVRKIAERHGGNITARSAPGQGASFIITIPSRQNKESEGQ